MCGKRVLILCNLIPIVWPLKSARYRIPQLRADCDQRGVCTEQELNEEPRISAKVGIGLSACIEK